MAILTKAQLEALNQASFPDQSSEAITPAILRTYNTATIDTLVDSLDTGSFTTDAEFNAYTSSTDSSLSQLNAFTSSQSTKNSTLGGITGSFLTTASVNLNTITFTKQDSSTFAITVNTGSGGGGTTDISSLNAFTASQDTKNSTLQSYTSSVNTQLSNLSISSSIDVQKWINISSQSGSWGVSSGSVSPGTVSGSAQIVGLGFLQTSSFQTYTGSQDTKNATLAIATASLNASTASQQLQINSLIAATGSYALTSSIVPLTSLNAFSASQQTKDSTLATYTASVDTKFTSVGISTSSLNAYTASQNTINNNLATSASIYETKFATIGGQSGSWGAGSPIPTGTVSSSAQILGYGIFATTGSNIFNGNQTILGTLLTTDRITVSSSAGIVQINEVANIFTISGSNSGSYGTSYLSISSDDENRILIASTGKTGTQPNLESKTNPFIAIKSGSINALGNTQYVAIDFQSATGYTDGRVTFPTTLVALQNVAITGSLTASGLRYPTTDGAYNRQVLQTDAAGTLSFGNVGAIYQSVHNGEATSLTVGTAVYVSGSQGDNPTVYRAVTTDSTKMPAQYVISETITAGNVGRALLLGVLEGYNVGSLAAGTQLYVDGSGVLTDVRPTGSTDVIQPIAIVTKTGSGGQLSVLNPGPVLLPNIQTGYAWVGNGNNQPIAVSTSSFSGGTIDTGSFATTGSNSFDGNQTITGSLVATSDITTETDLYGANVIISNTAYIDAIQGNLGGTLLIQNSAEVTGSLNVSGDIIMNSGSYSGSAISNITPDSSSLAPTTNIVTLTAAEYALITPVATTLYIVI